VLKCTIYHDQDVPLWINIEYFPKVAGTVGKWMGVIEWIKVGKGTSEIGKISKRVFQRLVVQV